ncbi:hypothetical protein AB0M78_34370, partial [Streptomyces sp. NPDC051162]
MTPRFGLVVRFTLRDADTADSFDALVSRTLEGIRQHEQGTVRSARVSSTIRAAPHSRATASAPASSAGAAPR